VHVAVAHSSSDGISGMLHTSSFVDAVMAWQTQNKNGICLNGWAAEM